MVGAKTIEAQIADGTARVQGDASILTRLATTLVAFDPLFEILPGTRARGAARPTLADAYQADPGRAAVE